MRTENPTPVRRATLKLSTFTKRTAAVVATIGFCLAALLSTGAPANATTGSNGVVNGYGYGQVQSMGCWNTTMNPVVTFMGGAKTTGVAFRFWMRPSDQSAWSVLPWHSYSVRPNTYYTVPGAWSVMDENIPQRGTGNYIVYAEFEFYSAGAWRGDESVRIGNITSTYGFSEYTGWYCLSQQF